MIRIDCATHSSSDVWYSWTNYEDCTTNASATWSKWNTSTTATTFSSTDTVWTTWASTSTAELTKMLFTTKYETDEDRARALERAAEIEKHRQREIEKAKRKERAAALAEETAKELLKDLLAPDQIEVYNRTGRVLVKGQKFDYIVQKTGFIKRVDKNKVTDLCVHLEDRNKYPDTDNVVSLVLGLKYDEERILEMANEHQTRDYEKLDAALAL